MAELPKKCNECNKDCGGRDMPTAWAVYHNDGSYWLCGICYRMFLMRGQIEPVDNRFIFKKT